MYYYIYDSFTKQARYSKILSRISLKLTDLGILGEEARVSPLRKVDDLVKEAVMKDYKNIIAVGDDSLACQVISALAKSDQDLSFGIIPLRKSKIAEVLGIPYLEAACEIISARRLVTLDLGKVANQYFLVSLDLGLDQKEPSSWFKNLRFAFGQRFPEVELRFKEGFTVTAKIARLSILNILNTDKGILRIKTNEGQKVSLLVSPKDGLLDIVICGKLSKWKLIKHMVDIQKKNFKNIPNLSFFRTKGVEISSKDSISVLANGQVIKKIPIKVKVVPKKITVICGKERKF